MKKRNILAVFACLLAAGAGVYAVNYFKPVLLGEEPVAETTTATTEVTTTVVTEPPKPFGYVHGEEGYFSLIDAGEAPEIKKQQGGSCWVVSASLAMESEHLRTTGKKISIDPYVLMDSVYRRFKSEGYFLKDELSALDYGGSCWQIVQSMSNGYNGWMLTEANDYDDVPRETLQEELSRRGALNAGVPDRPSSKKQAGDYYTMNDPDAAEEDYDHAVILIGWDDHFPKDYFRTPASQDGAWLAQDSRSETRPYYWISYDTPLSEVFSYTVSGMHGTIGSYDCGKMEKIRTGQQTSVANVFHHAGTLTGVGTFTSEPDQQITVEIRAGEFGMLLCAQQASFPFKGYHTVKLDAPQNVSDCTVIVRFDGAAPVEGEKWENADVEYRVKCDEGESFAEVSGEWMDLSEQTTRQALGLDFKPNNACIKAIFQ